MRKPVQIVTGSIGEPYGDEGNGTEVIGHTIYALCDDGSIWGYDEGHIWTRLPDIPQDEPKPVTSPNVVEALRKLANFEEEYRETYVKYRSGHLYTGRAWDRMRKAGDAARDMLKRIDEQEG